MAQTEIALDDRERVVMAAHNENFSLQLVAALNPTDSESTTVPDHDIQNGKALRLLKLKAKFDGQPVLPGEILRYLAGGDLSLRRAEGDAMENSGRSKPTVGPLPKTEEERRLDAEWEKHTAEAAAKRNSPDDASQVGETCPGPVIAPVLAVHSPAR